MADYLLDHGARGKISLESFLQFFGDHERTHLTSQKQQNAFGLNVKQPIEVAIIYELTCDIVSRLIAAGADASTLTSESYPHYTYSDDFPLKGETILDLLRGKIEKCEKFLSTEEKKPVEFKERFIYGPEVLEQYEEGTYERFYAEQHWRNQNTASKLHNKSKTKPAVQDTIALRDATALRDKRAAVEKLLITLKETETTLTAAGAKTYFELFPERHQQFLKQQLEARFANFPSSPFPTPLVLQPTIEEEDHSFKVSHSVNAPYLGEEKASNIQAGYKRMFEAIWHGTSEDASLVKELTLGPSGEGDNIIPALRISVLNDLGWSTLWLALYRRNWDMAKLILAIVEQQYEPLVDSTREKRFVLDFRWRGDAQIIENTVESAFTMEVSGPRKDLVKCNVSPYVGV